MPEPAPLRPGDPESLGAYTLAGRLGVGGQGVVYLGRDQAGTAVAVKVLHADLAADEEMLALFLREVNAAKRVARFCTAQILDADVAGDRPYVVSEYVEGPSLAALVTRDGPRTGAALERLAIGMATALTAIHQAGIIHHDFKPGNVLVGPDGPRVIDFGISRALDVSMSVSGGRPVGTPAYMAPEQFQAARIGPALDVFSFGSTLVYAANGRPPFGSDTLGAVMNRILTLEPGLGELSGVLRDLAAACLAKNPADRPGAREILLSLLSADPGLESGAILASGLSAADTTIPPTEGTDPGSAPAAEPERETTRPGGPTPRNRRVRNGVLAGASALAATGVLIAAASLSDDGQPAAKPGPGTSSIQQAAGLPPGGRKSPGLSTTPAGVQPPASGAGAATGKAPTTQPAAPSTSHPATASATPATPTATATTGTGTGTGTLRVEQSSFSLGSDWTTVTDQITATGGPVQWTATAGTHLRVTPGGGSLGSGEQATLTITRKGKKAQGSSEVVLSGDFGSVTIQVSWG